MSGSKKNRELIVLAGEQQASLARAKVLISNFSECLILEESIDIKGILGKEYQAIIYNLYRGFDPDVLGAIGGTIVAGGVLILVTPPLDQWPDYNDPFKDRITNWPYQGSDLSAFYIQRFIAKLKQASFVKIITEAVELPLLSIPDKVIIVDNGTTKDQAGAIEKIVSTFNSDQPVPFVLEADRGRGKSAVLGMVSARLAKNLVKILITAPTRRTADVIFRHAGESSQLIFIAPDQLCHELPEADVLLVDEAAAIPSPLLTAMLKQYPRIIFSTTVHGYEGTGRGFALRFKKQLDFITPNWKKLSLLQPIRYADNDPLEQFLFDSLLLNAKPVDAEKLTNFTLAECRYEKIDSETLIKDEVLLREVFGLLVLAHYQTRPTDLRHLLDGKEVTVSVIKWQEHVIATALCVLEGGFDEVLAKDIHYGKRRPRGHLVPQSLAVHAGIADAPLYKTERVMRIVVHPALQRRGVARLLLKTIESFSTADYLSCSFGATQGLLEFWNKQGFEAARIGLSRDASSGCHSVIMMKPLTDQGRLLFSKARIQFWRYFSVLLSEPLRDFEEELIQALEKTRLPIQKLADEELEISEQDQQDIHSFAYGHRGYENCMLVLQKIVHKSVKNEAIWSQINDNEKIMLQQKILEQKSWLEVSQQVSLSGRKQVLKKIRDIIQHIVEIS